MAYIRFLFDNIVDAATVTADPAADSAFPVTNLQLATERERVFRSTSTAQQDVKLTWAANQIANVAWETRNNATTSGTRQPRLYSDAAWSVNTAAPTASAAFVTSGLDVLDQNTYLQPDFRHLKHSVVYFTERSDIRSMIWRMADAANPDGYHEATKLLIGKYRELTYNPQVGDVELTQMSGDSGSRADDFSHIVDVGGKARRLVLNLAYVHEDNDQKWLLALGRYCGTNKEFGIDCYPGDDSADGIYNRMVGRLVSHPTGGPVQYGVQRGTLVFEET